MAKTWFNIRAATAASPVPVVSILDYIGYWGVEAPQFLAEYRAAVKGAERVKLLISTPGGDVMQGLAIANGMKAAKVPVDVEVIGIAASMGSYIAVTVGDTITMPDNTFMFIHDPISGVFGNAEDMRGAADDLDKVGGSLYSGYLARWKGTEDEFKAAMSAETLLTAAECLELGLCDTVTAAVEARAAVDVDMLAPSIRDRVTAAFAARTPEPTLPTPVLPTPTLPAPAADATLSVTEITALATERGMADLAPVLATLNSPTRTAVTARLDEAVQIMAVAKAAAYDEGKAIRMVRSGKSVAEARKAINAHLMAQDEAANVISTPPAPRAPAPSALVKPVPTWDEIHALKAKSYATT